MEVVAEVANDAGRAALADKTENFDLSFLPKSLTAQCQSLIESYHELHGYACLPDILWKARLGPFIETHREFRQLLRKASTTRSAKKSNEGFVRIATTILSLEILASSFAGWSAIYPEAGSTGARDSQAQCAQPAYAFDGILSVSAEIYQFRRHRDARPASASSAQRSGIVSGVEAGTLRRKTGAQLHQCDCADAGWKAAAYRHRPPRPGSIAAPETPKRAIDI